MSIYSASDSEDDAGVRRTRRPLTPQEAWARWTARRSDDDVAAIKSEVAGWLDETVRLQSAGDLFLHVQQARFCALPLLDEVVATLAAEIAAELVEEHLIVDDSSAPPDEQPHDLR